MAAEAWVTLATNDSYALGVLVLAHSLKDAASTRPLVVMITGQVSQSMRTLLNEVCGRVVDVEIIDSNDAAHLALLARPELGITLTKLHCWTLTDYTKCVFLDADTLVVRNCDELFDKEELSAAPDAGWPDCFNSGVFVFQPSMETYSALIKLACDEGSFDGGDQGLLNLYFSDWATREDNTRRLPFIYNMTYSASYFYRPAYKQYGKNVRIVHFIGSPKPWHNVSDSSPSQTSSSGSSNELAGIWWDIFNSRVRPQLSSTMVMYSSSPLLCTKQDLPTKKEPEHTGGVYSADYRQQGSDHSTLVVEKLTILPQDPIPNSTLMTPLVKESLTPIKPEIVGLASHFSEAPKEEQAVGGDSPGQYHSAEPQPSKEEDEARRRQAWERGEIDYTGRDSFNNLMEKMQQTLLENTKK